MSETILAVDLGRYKSVAGAGWPGPGNQQHGEPGGGQGVPRVGAEPDDTTDGMRERAA